MQLPLQLPLQLLWKTDTNGLNGLNGSFPGAASDPLRNAPGRNFLGELPLGMATRGLLSGIATTGPPRLVAMRGSRAIEIDPFNLELTRFRGHLTMQHREVFRGSVIGEGRPAGATPVHDRV